jgi:hypothetical protein
MISDHAPCIALRGNFKGTRGSMGRLSNACIGKEDFPLPAFLQASRGVSQPHFDNKKESFAPVHTSEVYTTFQQDICSNEVKQFVSYKRGTLPCQGGGNTFLGIARFWRTFVFPTTQVCIAMTKVCAPRPNTRRFDHVTPLQANQLSSVSELAFQNGKPVGDPLMVAFDLT